MLRIRRSRVNLRALWRSHPLTNWGNPGNVISFKGGGLLLPLMASVLLSACVSQSTYDQLQAQYQQLQQKNAALSAQVAAEKAQVCRLQGAIKYTVNSDLLFSSGGWQMNDRGQQIIANMASKLAPTQQNPILVSGYTDNAPIGPALQREGITSNQILSQKRAENVMEFIISQGAKPDLVSAKGFGDLIRSLRTLRHRAARRTVASSYRSRRPGADLFLRSRLAVQYDLGMPSTCWPM